MPRVLVVEDDPNIRRLVRINLEQRGFSVFEAQDGAQAIAIFKDCAPDLVLLDLILPDIDGLDVCLWIRAQSNVPVVVLSAREEEERMVSALNAGADDYVTKPFRPNELPARLHAVLRRAQGQARDERTPIIQIQELVIDRSARRVTIDGQDVPLTGTEFALLDELANKPDSVLTHEELLTRVWGPEYRDESHYLYIYFSRIRKKLGETYEPYLTTVPGIGYLLRSNLG